MKKFFLMTTVVTLLLSLIACSNIPTSDEKLNDALSDDSTADNDTTGTGTDKEDDDEGGDDDDYTENPIDTITDTMSYTSVDLLFEQLIKEVETLGDVENLDDVYEIKFAEFGNSFENIINKEPENMKASIGFIISEVLALNSSSALQKVADSLDSFFSEWDDSYGYDVEPVYYDEGFSSRGRSLKETPKEQRISRSIFNSLFTKKGRSNTFSRSLRSNGVNGLGTTLLAKTPEIILSRSATPSFPKFITIGHIQNIVDREILPVINKVSKVMETIEEKNSTGDIKFTIDEEKVEIDVADIYLLDASFATLKSGLLLFTTYNFDVWTSASDKSYNWISDLNRLDDNFEYESINTYSLNSDTLQITYENIVTNEATEFYEYTYDLMKYNLGRSDFLTIRSENHAKAYAALKSVPEKIRKAVEALENESDNQEDDLIAQVDLSDINGEMQDIAGEMIAEGFSSIFADNFKSPTALADFVETLLNEPYNFNQNIDGIAFDITVDISKFFTNPVEDLRDWLPLHRLVDKDDILFTYTYDYNYVYDNGSGSSNFYPNDDDSIDIDNSLYTYEDGQYTLTSDYYYEEYVDIYTDFMPFELIDNDGNSISFNEDDMEDMIFEDAEIPYFKDYTFNGVFPDMSRNKWNSLLSDVVNEF